ncbi:MAG: hypothetical protein RIM23_29620 [Coleofasciculus sp. G3-WIS-01]
MRNPPSSPPDPRRAMARLYTPRRAMARLYNPHTLHHKPIPNP